MVWLIRLDDDFILVVVFFNKRPWDNVHDNDNRVYDMFHNVEILLTTNESKMNEKVSVIMNVNIILAWKENKMKK